ncbi:hypothetical protein Taro_019513 [Colocasia esculenta]|uniref:Uncharacterized protein n=1 Tax=Colocasia esculenta TaxID=4460 RepID=A0A843UZI9_COLES|nr:hypothetical protein [Colocasia esculenta]
MPILGHLHLLGPLPHQALHRLSTCLGPLMHLCLGSIPCVVASDAGTAQEFLRTHELSFSDWPGSISISYLTYSGANFDNMMEGILREKEEARRFLFRGGKCLRLVQAALQEVVPGAAR